MTFEQLYKYVCELEQKLDAQLIPDLEEYLRSLWLLVSQGKSKTLTCEQAAIWFDGAFKTLPPPLEESWFKIPNVEKEIFLNFHDWEKLILFQIADLRRMKQAEMLDDPHKWLGIRSTTGESWYNFHPLDYLECGVRGVIDNIECGSLKNKTDEFSWQAFSVILVCGQIYE